MRIGCVLRLSPGLRGLAGAASAVLPAEPPSDVPRAPVAGLDTNRLLSVGRSILDAGFMRLDCIGRVVFSLIVGRFRVISDVLDSCTVSSTLDNARPVEPLRLRRGPRIDFVFPLVHPAAAST